MGSVYAETLLEDFFVAAVTSVLAIRLFLHITGYPSVALGGLHIAHVLIGGLLMLIALVLLLAFINRSAYELAAVIGGIGFGAFIDELGKFITSDNDYFFEPAVALIYVSFILLFYGIRAIAGRQAISREECFANAFEIGKQASVTGLGPEERQLALGLLERCAIHDPSVQNLRTILLGMPAATSGGSPVIARLKGAIHRFYEYVTARWWFTGVVVGFFAFVSISSLLSLVALFQWSWALALWLVGGGLILAALFWTRRVRVRQVNIVVTVAIVVVAMLMTWVILGSLKREPLSLVDWAQFVFPGVSGIITAFGLLLIPISRLRAYRMFRRAILISIFFTQVLAFYEYSFLALTGLLVNIMILLGLRYMISNEEVKLEGQIKEPGSGTTLQP